jgi:hypothetical protein
MKISRTRWLHGHWRLAWLFLPAIAMAAIVTAQQVADAVRNSPAASSFLRTHAAEIGVLAIKVESGGDTTAYNGSCCYGVLQLNTTNIIASGYTVDRYRNATLQEQVDAWSRIQSRALDDPVIRQLQAMSSFDGQPVDVPLLIACVQLGQGNCRTMVRAGTCTGFRDRNGKTICDMASAMRAAIGGSTPPGSPGGPPGGVARGGGPYVPGSSGAGVAPNTAFEGASGMQMSEAADSIRLIAGALLLLWLTWASRATWMRFVRGGTVVQDMSTTIIRAAGVALVSLLLLS